MPMTSELHVVMSFHDDWLLSVLLSDGRFYTFNTELWSQHGSDSCWPRVEDHGRKLAMVLALQGEETWGLDAIPDTLEQFREAVNFVAMRATDQEFARNIKQIIT